MANGERRRAVGIGEGDRREHKNRTGLLLSAFLFGFGAEVGPAGEERLDEGQVFGVFGEDGAGAFAGGGVGVEEIGTDGGGFEEALDESPGFDFCVMPRKQDLGHAAVFELLGAGVVGAVEESGVEGVVDGGVGVAEDAFDHARDGVDDNHGWEFAAGEDKVADGDFFVYASVDDALVDAFVVAADEDKAGERGELAGFVLGENGALGAGKEDAGAFGCAGVAGDGVEGAGEGFGFEDHATASAVRGVVDDFVAVLGVVAEVVDAEVEQTLFPGPSEDAFGQGAFEPGGEEGEDIDADHFPVETAFREVA